MKDDYPEASFINIESGKHLEAGSNLRAGLNVTDRHGNRDVKLHMNGLIVRRAAGKGPPSRNFVYPQ